jgi:nucleotide-binding universal stress UspA family protein
MKTLDSTSSLDSTSRVRFANVLFPTDFTPSADKALPYALEIARRYHATIHATHVLQPDMYALLPPASWPKLAELEAETRQEYRQRLETQLGDQLHEIIFQAGEIWPTLAEIIKTRNIDLVVVGTHAPLALEKAVLGSVAEEIFRQAACPVLTVGPSAPAKPRQMGELSSILYATDFTPESLAGAPYAISLAREHRAHLILLYCREESQDVHTFRHALYEIVPFGAELRCQPDCIVEHGRPAEKILEAAEAHGADMIVLGVRGSEHLARITHLAQTGSYHIVAHAKCPVLTVRG